MARDFVGFISYAHRDGNAFARGLKEKLARREPEITLWKDQEQMAGGIDFEEQIRDAIDNVSYLILVQTPDALRSKWVEKEWRYARERGVCVCPVKGASDAELEDARRGLPRWMAQAHSYDTETEWDRFVAFLKSPCTAPRVPFMAAELPPVFVERPQEFDLILAQVLDAGRGNPSGKRVVLQGSGGFGKTTLAVSVCHDGDVIAACDGGILWTTLGEQPSPIAALTKLYAALTGERPQFVDADDASIEVAKKLTGRRCLLVIDDVWDGDHLKPFLRGGAECTRLITTRSAKIASDIADAPCRINVGELQPSQAVQLLLSRLESPPPDLSPFRALARRLGEWPMLLELANSTLAEQISLGETVAGALAWMNQALDRMNVVAFDRENPAARHQAIASTIEVSLQLLKENRRKCLELSIFPEDADVPLDIAGLVWMTDDFETRRLAQRLNELSLLKLNLPTRTLRLHDAMRGYLKTQLGDSAALHSRLADSWRDPARVAGEYALRHAAYHLVEAMSAPGQARPRAAQLLRLLTDARLHDYQQKHGDLVELHRQLGQAQARLAGDSHPDSGPLLAALSLAASSFAVERQPGWIFDIARQGNPTDAEERLELFDAEPEWETAARLAIAWTGWASKPEDSREIASRASARSDRPELQRLLAWVREAPSGVPSGTSAFNGGPGLDYVAGILKRAGGAEGMTGIEPLDTNLAVSGISSYETAFIAERDGPDLVAFAALNPASNTTYLRQYIAIHAANKYRYYRNRSLWSLLKPVLEFPDAAWVREIVEELIRSALAVTPIDFKECLPLAVHALRAQAGDNAAAEALMEYRRRLFEEAAALSPERGKGDSWSYYHRRAAFMAEVSATVLGLPADAEAAIQLARALPKGFAGFRCASAMTLAESARIALPTGETASADALISAQAASHRIQDYGYCLQMTSMVNAMRARWWPAGGLDVEAAVARFLASPEDPEFAIVHRIGEDFAFREKGPHTLPIPPQVLEARTLRALAPAYRRSPEALAAANPGAGWGPDDPLNPGTEVNIPDPDFRPVLAARLAGEALAARDLKPDRRRDLIRSLAAPAGTNATTLDTVLARLLLASAGAALDIPPLLAGLALDFSTPGVTDSEQVVA
jgi:hypothetical protein